MVAAAAAFFLAMAQLPPAPPASDTTPLVTNAAHGSGVMDSTSREPSRPSPTLGRRAPAGLARTVASDDPQDTLPRRRRAVAYSDAYATRLTIHRRLSYAMLPLFAASYLSGDRILKDGSDAPPWARSVHRPAATATAVLFTANTVTGAWNLWEGRHDSVGRTRRLLHATLFVAASAGFTYSGVTLAEQAERSNEKRLQHRNVNLASMGVASASWLLMILPH